MQISVTEAKGRLTELVRRAEAGEEVVLIRHGQATVKLEPMRRRPDADARRLAITRVRAAAASKRTAAVPVPPAARIFYTTAVACPNDRG